MKRSILWCLAVLNVLLLASFVMRVTRENTAIAQGARPSDYVMIPGEVTGGTAQVVYVIDAGNRLLGAVSYDDSRKALDAMMPIDLGHLTDAASGTTPPGGRAPVTPRR
jgi:hypothetical protein